MKRWSTAAAIVLLTLWIAGCTGGTTSTTENRVTPPVIPHTLVARSDCLLCHVGGVAGAPAMPDYHLGLQNETCTVCHKTAARPSPTATSTLQPVATPSPTQPAAATPTLAPGVTPSPTQVLPPTPTYTSPPTPTAASASPPTIPHSLEGRGQCLTCHGSGLAGIPQVPTDHQGRTNETCTLCHQPR